MKRLVLLLFILLSANLAYGQQRGRDGGHRATSVQRDSHGHSGGATVRDHGSSRSSGGARHSEGTVRSHSSSGSVRSGGHHSGGSVSHSGPGRTSGGAVRSGSHHSGGSGHSSGHSASGAIRSGGHQSVGHVGGNVSHGSGHHGGQHSGHVEHGGHHVHHGGHRPAHHIAPRRAHHVRYYPVRVRNYRRIRPLLHRDIIICINDWQPLWNGYYVRRYVDRIWICNAVGDRIVQGDEVILLPNGYYKVRNGDFWRVYDERGESIFNIWGEEVNLLDNGVFECYRAGMYFYYDELGNRLD